VGFDDLKIRDLSRLSGEWTPPIGVMGGPPAHELYADLVVHAGLQLFRDVKSRPWVVLRDGAQRRAFLVPSAELRGALDRFRMRRNLRPVPEGDIQEFARVVEARTSDPDVTIPVLKAPVSERATVPEREPSSDPPDGHPLPRWKELEDRIDSALRDLDELDRHPVRSLELRPPPAIPDGGENDDIALTAERPRMDVSISGARPLPEGQDANLARYVRVLGQLVHDGSWMGTTQELAKLTKDDPMTMFDALLRYRSELADHNILIANIEVEGGYRWLAVNRATIRGATDTPASSPRMLAAE
jgi:hypothetical protein